MTKPLRVSDIDQFHQIVKVPEAAITSRVLAGLRALDERTEFEPAFQDILFDPNQTPHGPTEIADVMQTKVIVRGCPAFAAFILKGKSLKKVRTKDVGYQIMKVRQLPKLDLMGLIAVGDIQDDLYRDFIQAAADAGADYLVVDRVECARLLVAYEKICGVDGTRFGPDGRCKEGHQLDEGITLEVRVRDGLRHEQLALKDISHAHAKRFSVELLVDPHYTREQIREVVRTVVPQVRRETYCRSKEVRDRWSDTPAHVVWVYVGSSMEDITSRTWILRAQWVDEALDPRWSPAPLDGTETLDGIGLAWNEMYGSMKALRETNRATKGAYLEAVEPILSRMIELGLEATALSAEVGLPQEEVIRRMRAHVAEVDDLYNASGDVPFAPPELTDFDTAFETLIGTVHNLYLPFGDSGLKTWNGDQRDGLLTLYRRTFEEELRRLEFEREKIH